MAERKSVKVRNLIGLTVLLVLVFGFLVPRVWDSPTVRREVEKFIGIRLDTSHHFYDYAGVIQNWDGMKFEEYMKWIEQESDIDLRIVLVNDLGGKSIEDAAVEMVEAFKIGGKTGQERGTLLLYDLSGKRLRIEVGYGLEGYFPDAFVNYLIEDHTRAFFATRDLSVGLRLLLRLLHYRIRQAKLGDDYDPTVLETIRRQGHLSGGAGASATVAAGQERNRYLFATGSKEEREYFAAQGSPEATYEKYLEWLLIGRYNPVLPIFTKDSQGFLVTLQMTKAYLNYILMQEYGKSYTVDTRGDVALISFTDDPMITPHLLKKSDAGWHLDIVAEVADTAEHTGGRYTWCWRGQGDIYTQTFADKLIYFGGCRRTMDGDNRTLPVRDDQ